MDPEKILSQGYDGASFVDGKYKGVQQWIKEIAPHAEYILCYAYTHNLVLVDSTESCHEIFGRCRIWSGRIVLFILLLVYSDDSN